MCIYGRDEIIYLTECLGCGSKVTCMVCEYRCVCAIIGYIGSINYVNVLPGQMCISIIRYAGSVTFMLGNVLSYPLH